MGSCLLSLKSQGGREGGGSSFTSCAACHNGLIFTFSHSSNSFFQSLCPASSLCLPLSPSHTSLLSLCTSPYMDVCVCVCVCVCECVCVCVCVVRLKQWHHPAGLKIINLMTGHLTEEVCLRNDLAIEQKVCRGFVINFNSKYYCTVNHFNKLILKRNSKLAITPIQSNIIYFYYLVLTTNIQLQMATDKHWLMLKAWHLILSDLALSIEVHDLTLFVDFPISVDDRTGIWS